MIKTKPNRLLPIVKIAQQKASQTKKPCFISVIEKVSSANPLSFFEEGKNYMGERIFWQDSQGELVLVGIGSATMIQEGEERFQSVRTHLQNLYENLITEGDKQVPGTGFLSFGGFCFDPYAKKKGLWDSFPDTKFTVPMFLLTKRGQDIYLTINALVDHEKAPEDFSEFLLQESKRLLESTTTQTPPVDMVDVKEIGVDTWKEHVHQVTEEIKKGRVDKVVLARELRAHFSGRVAISSILKKLVSEHPNSYIFIMESGDDCFVGASPERLVKVENQEVLSTCLAGTAPRGKTEEEDRIIGTDLLSDSKNLQEHQFVVQMIKESVADCCKTLSVPKQPILYPLRHMQHLYTPVRGILKDDMSLLDIVERLHPTPALGGEPREDALTFIRDYEDMERGWYGAPIGWLDQMGNGEFAVAIRSALIHKDQASLFAGCGVVEDSDPEAEYEETRIKFGPMLSVLGGPSR
ncbi:isochorismate synthase [Bacillaceae bacterium S4-13-56]